MEWVEALENKNKDHWKDHWVDLVLNEDGCHWYKAAVKWDGCIHFNRAYNEPFNNNPRDSDNEDYIHICDIDEYIEILQKLKVKAIEYFKKHERKWPDC